MGRLADKLRELIGISPYEQPIFSGHPQLDSASTQEVIKRLGGQLQPLPSTQTRWYQADLEVAQYACDAGDMGPAARIARAMRRDGMIGGLSKTRTAGLVSLPKRFRGNPEAVAKLRADNGTRPIFDEMLPSAELARLAEDGIQLGVGVGIMAPIVNRGFPVLQRLEPEFLSYRWSENRWYYRSVVGTLPITPGDGRWVLHAPGGANAPWQAGLWPCLGRAFILKDHAMLNRGNYAGKLANPARVAYSAAGADDETTDGFLAKLIAWGVNTVFSLPPGWDVKLLESNGRGWEVFEQEIATANLEAMIALAGQEVTVTGGTGFANADIHKTIRADLIKETADALAYTINTQALPVWEVPNGVDLRTDPVCVAWDTDPPKDRKAEADAMKGIGDAVVAVRDALAAAGLELDVEEIANRFGLPIKGRMAPAEPPETQSPAPEGDKP